MKPDGILNAGIDSKEQEPLFEQAAAAGVKVVGWHAGPKPGPDKDIPSVFTNVTTDPAEVAKSAGYEAVVNSDGQARRHPVHRLDLRHRHRQDQLSKAAVEGCKGCKVLEVADTPIGDLSNRMGQLTTSLLSKYGKKWTYSIAVNDLYYDFSAPSLQAAGVDPATGYAAADLVRRRLRAGVQAHPRQAISARHRRRAAQPARLDHDRRDQPRLRRREAERLRAARASVHRRERRQGRRRARTSSIPATAIATSTRRSGA